MKFGTNTTRVVEHSAKMSIAVVHASHYKQTGVYLHAQYVSITVGSEKECDNDLLAIV